jgi:hypothetical protein
MPSLKKLSAQLIGFTTVVVLAVGSNVAPAQSATETTVNGVQYSIVSPGIATAWSFTSDLPSSVTVESSVNIGGSAYSVTSISGNGFNTATGLTSVTIPASVTSFPDCCSFYQTGLTSVTFLGAAPTVSSRIFDSYVSSALRVYYYKRFGSGVVSGGFGSTWQAITTVGVDEPQTLTPTPTINGQAGVGVSMFGFRGTWDTGVSKTFAWYRDGVAISGATSEGYTPVVADIGKALTFKVTGTKTNFVTTSKTSAATELVVPAMTLAPTLTITGSANLDKTLTAVTGTWDADVVFTYQWNRAGTAITAATSSTYALVTADLTKTITVDVTATKTGYSTTTKTSAATAAVGNGIFVLTPTPTITGTVTVGNTLTAVPGTWDSGTTFAYVWKRAGANITGATASTYALVAADYNTAITVAVTGSKTNYTASSQTSSATAAVAAGAQTLSPTPTISGTTSFGQTLTAAPGTWDSGSTLSYQWNRAGSAITSATSATYTLVAADVGTAITVTVSSTKTGYTTTSKTSAATASIATIAMTLTPTPTITGTATVGQTLTAVAGTWDAGMTLTYSWLRAGVAISLATASTYVLAAADMANQISVIVTGSKSGYTTTDKTSANTSSVAGQTMTLIPTPTISGTAKLGETLTAAPGTWDAGVTLSYQWKRSGSAISGATSSTYTAVAADRGAALSVTVVATKAGFATATRTSGSTNAVESR